MNMNMVYHGFTQGSKVEVRSDDEGFRGACYVATIIEEPKSNKCWVVYDQLKESEEEDSNNLKEVVDVSQLRPLPPVNSNEIIKVHDIVDAYYNDGWWTGEVIETLEDGRFLVYFYDPPDEQAVKRSDIRLHFDWLDGKWEKSQIKSNFFKMISPGTTVEVILESENYNVWHLGRVLQAEGNDRFLVKYRCPGDDTTPNFQTDVLDSRCIRPSPPRLNAQDFVVRDKVDVYYQFCWWSGVVHEVVNEMRYIVLVTQSKLLMMCTRVHLRPRLDWIKDKWTTTSPNTSVLIISNETAESSRKKSSERKVETTMGQKSNALVCVDEADKKPEASSDSPSKKNGKRKIRDHDKNMKGSTGMERTLKRNSGKQKQLSLEEQIGKDGLMLTMVDNEPEEDHFMLSCKDYMNLILAERKIMNHLCKRDELLSRTHRSLIDGEKKKTRASRRVRKAQNKSLSYGQNNMTPNIRVADDQEDGIVKEQSKEYMLEWHGEAHNNIVSQDHGANGETSSAFATKDVLYTPLQKSAPTDLSKKGREFETPSTMISWDSMDYNEQVPFVKSSPLWKSIESMEVCSKAQRMPHFRPLLECDEVTREGLAIAHMVTFSTVVDKTLKLRFSDPRSVIECNLKTLANLEKHGFDVEPVRARLMMLLAKKQKEGELEAKYKQIENAITKNVLEIDELGQEIIHINRTMKELAEKLMKTQTRKQMKEGETVSLQSKRKAIREDVGSVEQEFESAADCPL